MWKKTRRDEYDATFVWVDNGEIQMRVAAPDMDQTWFVSPGGPWKDVEAHDVVAGEGDGSGIYVVTLRGNMGVLWLRTALEMLRTNLVNLKKELDANQKMMDDLYRR